MALWIVREGEGEEDALPNLVFRLCDRLGVSLPGHNTKKHGRKRPLLTRPQVQEACGIVQASPGDTALLLTRDADQDQLADQDCPKYTAPEMATWVRELDLPFPVAVVLFYKEFETLFLAGATGLAGREICDSRSRAIGQIPVGVDRHPSPETPRDAKGWVRANLVTGYKPTLHQAPLTRLLDLADLDASGLSSYRRFGRALEFLALNLGETGAVYPTGKAGNA